MTAATFNTVFPLLLKTEAGYVDDSHDPGGATNLGITIRTLGGWLGRPATKAEVKALTPAAVAPIYRKNYWDAVQGDALPTGLDYAVFDFAVNSGPQRAVIALQRALGVADDGKLGPITLAALKGRDVAPLIGGVCDDRLGMMRKLSTWPRFGKGWTTRVAAVRKEALKMAAAPAPLPSPPHVDPAGPLPPLPTGTARPPVPAPPVVIGLDPAPAAAPAAGGIRGWLAAWMRFFG